MTYREIKSLLALKGIKSVDIARAAGVTSGTVSPVIRGLRRSHNVESAIAKALRMPIGKLFPPNPHRKQPKMRFGLTRAGFIALKFLWLFSFINLFHRRPCPNITK